MPRSPRTNNGNNEYCVHGNGYVDDHNVNWSPGGRSSPITIGNIAYFANSDGYITYLDSTSSSYWGYCGISPDLEHDYRGLSIYVSGIIGNFYNVRSDSGGVSLRMTMMSVVRIMWNLMVKLKSTIGVSRFLAGVYFVQMKFTFCSPHDYYNDAYNIYIDGDVYYSVYGVDWDSCGQNRCQNKN